MSEADSVQSKYLIVEIQSNGIIRDVSAGGLLIGTLTGDTNFDKLVDSAGRPPLGLMPRYVWDEQFSGSQTLRDRLNMVSAAMVRFTKEGRYIPRDWIIEHDDLFNQLDTEHTGQSGD